MIKPSILLILAFTFLVPKAISQEHVAPTLQVGLSGFKFNQGALDHELILEIISDKQKEVKERLVKYMFLNNLSDAGATIYGFVDNTIDIIRTVEDPEIRTRSIIENSVNLAIVSSFTEYALLQFQEDKDLDTIYNFFGRDTTYSLDIPAFNSISDATFYEKEDKKEKGTKKNNFKRAFESKFDTKFKSFLMDMCAIIINENQDLKRLGVYRNSYVNLYASQNSFELYKNEIGQSALNFKKKVKANLTQLTSFIGLFSYLDDLNSVHLSSFTDLTNQLETKTLVQKKLNDKIVSLESNLKKGLLKNSNETITISDLRNDLKTENNVRKKDMQDYVSDIQIITDFTIRLKILKITKKQDVSILSDLLFEISSKVLPASNRLVSFNPELISILADLTDINKHILGLVCEKSAKLSDKIFNVSFVTVLAKLYEFDEVETFEELIKLTLDAGSFFKDDKIYSTVQTITNFTNTYIKFVKDENDKEAIEFDVEGILAAMEEKQYNKHRALKFNFTVGSNVNTFSKPFISESDTLKSMAFVSEKIGFKIILWDWRYLRSFNKGETFRYYRRTYTRLKPRMDPIVDNIHLSFYGSGLLYNIMNLNTNKNFNYPIFGGGVGITFFNSLDFNVSIAKPLIFDNSDAILNKNIWMLNYGFDIRFGEYIDKLNEKRKQNKINKIKKEIRAEYQDMKVNE